MNNLINSYILPQLARNMITKYWVAYTSEISFSELLKFGSVSFRHQLIRFLGRALFPASRGHVLTLFSHGDKNGMLWSSYLLIRTLVASRGLQGHDLT